MRTLLRNRLSGQYFQGPDKWTPDPERAVDFRFIDRALHYVETWRLKDVELAFAFDHPLKITAMSLERAALQFAAA
jgi:hypothetical protein